MATDPQTLYLVTLTIRHAASQGVRGFGCGLQGPTQRANAIVDMIFGYGVAIRRVRSRCVDRPSWTSAALRLIPMFYAAPSLASTQITS